MKKERIAKMQKKRASKKAIKDASALGEDDSNIALT